MDNLFLRFKPQTGMKHTLKDYPKKLKKQI